MTVLALLLVGTAALLASLAVGLYRFGRAWLQGGESFW